ncbi:MAG: helix-hairpin-helix domain-containing protein [Pseudomonadota bacterium]|nr:helix-hairpin-helix domain-containing protein [Pseudomonadota bacterium]
MLKKLFAIIAMCWAAMAFAAVDANKATEAELTTVKGIGPAMSTKIVQERKKAPFKDWNDLKSRVKGIGDKTALKLSEGGLTVNGAAYGSAAKPAKAPAKAPTKP